MKKLGLLFLAVLMISLSSCGGDAENANDKAKTEVKADEAKADETKADEAKADEAKADEAKADEAKADVDGKALFASNGCTACHNATAKTVGPAIKTIGEGYAGKKDDLVKFLNGEGKAIIDAPQFAIMQPNIATTKKMNDAQRAAIADYMMSIK